MSSPFASPTVQNGLTCSFDTTPTGTNPNIWKQKKHAEFIVYKLPTMLERYTSLPVSSKTTSVSCYKQRRQRSIHTERVGIITNNNVKTVSFGATCTLLYKCDSV